MDIKKINEEITLPVAIVISAVVLAIGFYAVQYNKQQSIEKQQQIKIEQDKQDQLAKEIKEQQVKKETEQALNTCIVNAESSYSDQWYGECKSQGKLTSRCISLKEMTLDEYEKQNPDKTKLDAIIDFYKERDECSCRLPLDNADRINKTLQDNKDECFKKYPQN